MATSFVVISTDLRRANVKAPAGGYMIDMLEEACTKLKLNHENYQLKHNNKPINLTDPIRAAGLTQGAKLELVVKSKTPTAVTVALRLPPSEAALGIPNNRVSAKVRSDTPLWRLLRHLEEADGAKQKGLNITARGVPRTSHTGAATTGSTTAAAVGSGSGQLYWETPVLKLAGRELASVRDFRKTLSQVGIDTGSQLIVLEFRTSDTTLQEAMETVQTQLEKTDADVAAIQAAVVAMTAAVAPEALAQAAASTEPATTGNAAALALEESTPEPKAAEAPQPLAPAAAEPMDVDGTSSSSSAPQTALDLQPVQVWSPPKANAGMPAAASLRWTKEPESAFAPSIAQMKAHQRQLEEAGRNKRLKSDEELEEETREREAKAAAVNRIDIRIRFPDGYTVMWSFANGTTGATLHAAVRSVLHPAVKYQAFRLSPPMSRDEIQDRSGSAKDDLVRGYGMRGGILVNFRRGENVPAPPAGQPYVKPEVAALARDIVIPQVAADEDEVEEDKASSSKTGGDTKRPNKTEAINKMSKFLRLAKK
jgi:tether containing UBX domain for GLUT4